MNRKRLVHAGIWLSAVVLLVGLVQHFVRADSSDPAEPRSSSTVGMPGKIEQLVLPGSELEVKPLEDRRAPLVLRITEAYPHGSAFRYNLAYYGLEPGDYDLRNYLKRKDGTALGELPAIPVKVDPVLPPGQIQPNALPLERSPWMGGYRLLLAAVGSLWCAGLAAILVLGRHRRAESQAESARPFTLAQRLRPLIDSTLRGTLGEGQHAELERLLIGYWRKRLGLEQASPIEVMSALRSHPEAGALLRQLEEWLHKPGGNTVSSDLAELLRPYQDLKDDIDQADANQATSTVSASSSSTRESMS
jgi:hypothetical protein